MGLIEEHFKTEEIVWSKLMIYLNDNYGSLVANDTREQYLRLSISENEEKQENKQPTIEDVKF